MASARGVGQASASESAAARVISRHAAAETPAGRASAKIRRIAARPLTCQVELCSS